METELKLALPGRFIGRALRHPGVEAAAIEPPRTARLLSVYYDTPEFALCSAHVALRLRRAPQGWTQTVKWGGSALGGLHRRGEIETPVRERQLSLEALEHPELAAVFAQARLRKRLKPVFVTEFERISRLLRVGASRVELCADRGEIVAGSAREPISELELELVDGQAAALFDLAAELQAQLPLRPMGASKAERGYALAGHAREPVKALPVELTEELSIGQSALGVLASGLDQLQANERGMLSGRDPEYLHQMRVAVRRLRSALGAYADVLAGEAIAVLRAELKWAGARLGVARDWDVFHAELLPPLLRELRADPGLAALARAAVRERERANDAARAAVRSRRYARLILLLGRIVATSDCGGSAPAGAAPVLPFASKLLDRRHKKVVERGGKFERRSVAELHALRIAVKKLRYAGEFFATLYPGARTKSFRARLAALQESLGAINDQANLRQLAHSAMARPSRQLEALLAGWSARVVHEERTRLRATWRGFRRMRRFW